MGFIQRSGRYHREDSFLRMSFQTILTSAAGVALLGVASWLVSTTNDTLQEVYSIKKDMEVLQETLDKIYVDDCPYCVHALHSSMTEHPLLAPTIHKAHTHIEGGRAIYFNAH